MTALQYVPRGAAPGGFVQAGVPLERVVDELVAALAEAGVTPSLASEDCAELEGGAL